MTHDERFAEFRARREEERAAQIRVTWRKVSPMTGGGWSGLGPGGALVYVVLARDLPKMRVYEYGRVEKSKRVKVGDAHALHEAKQKAAALLGATA